MTPVGHALVGRQRGRARGPAARPVLRALVVALLAGLGLAGCSPSPTSEPPATTGAASPAARHDITVVDDADRKVTLTVPVRRVVAFNTFNVEFIRAVGAFDAVV